MLRNILISIALLFMSFATMTTTAQAASGYRFLPEDLTPQQMAPLTAASLKRDPTGNSPLMPERCSHDPDACATPIMYLQMFKLAVPPATVDGQPLTSVTQIPAFLNGLVEVPVPEGDYKMACTKRSATGYYADAECDHRTFHPGEKAYAYKTFTVNQDGKKVETTTIVLAGHCKNPVFGRWDNLVAEVIVQTTCVEISYDVPPNTEHVKVDFYGRKPHSEKCMGVKQPGEMNFSKFTTRCDTACFASAEESAQREGQIDIKSSEAFEYAPTAPGHHVVRMLLDTQARSGVSVCVYVKVGGTVRPYKGRHIWFHPTDRGNQFDLGGFKPL